MTLTSLPLVLGIGGAGALGAVARYFLGRLITERIRVDIPLGTLLINLSGAFFISLIFALVAHKLLSSTLQTLLATGFLGGYTTYSTLNWETLQLVRDGASTRGWLYLGGTYVLGLGLAALGLSIGGWL